MATLSCGISRSFLKLFFSVQNSRNFYASGSSRFYLGCICKSFCSNATPNDEKMKNIGSNDSELLRNETTGKELNLVVSSLRVDRVAATGFGIGRRKLDLLLLAGKLYLNKNKVEKRSLQVNSNDIIELVSKEQNDIQDEQDGRVYISRLEVNEIGQTTKKGNLRISLIRHRNISLDRGSFNQIYRKKKYK